MKANEARELADSRPGPDFDWIKRAIEKAADEGKYCAYWYDPISTPTRRAFERDGYVVKNDGRYNEVLYSISW